MEKLINRTEDLPILQATVGDLAKAIAYAIGIGVRKDEECMTGNPKTEVQKHYVYGLKGIANLLGCSYQTAARLKASGMFDGAYSQVNKLIIADADMILDLYSSSKVRQQNKLKKKW